MTRRRPTFHYGQLAAAVATYVGMTVALVVGADKADGPDAATWTPWFGAILTVWVFAVIWVLIALVLSARATWRAIRRPYRPLAGVDKRPALSLVDQANRAACLQAMADAWAAGDDGQDGELPVVDEYTAEARHAIRSAA